MYEEITRQLYEFFRLLEDEKKKTKDYGGGIELYHAEVTFLECITRNESENASGLAKCLGVSKGAVTQLSAKLLQKELIAAGKRDDNKKEKYYRLTRRGRQLMGQHHMEHDKANRRIHAFLATATAAETDVIVRFLKCLSQSMLFCEFACTKMNQSNKEENDESNTALRKRTARSTPIGR